MKYLKGMKEKAKEAGSLAKDEVETRTIDSDVTSRISSVWVVATPIKNGSCNSDVATPGVRVDIFLSF